MKKSIILMKKRAPGHEKILDFMKMVMMMMMMMMMMTMIMMMMMAILTPQYLSNQK